MKRLLILSFLLVVLSSVPAFSASFVSGTLRDSNSQPLTATIIVYSGGSIINSTTASTYNLSVSSGVYDIQYNLSGNYVKLMSVDLTSSVNNLINYVSQNSSAITFTSPSNLNFQIQSSSPLRVWLNGTIIAYNASLANNTYYYSGGLVYLKVTPDLKTDCNFTCCMNEARYRDKSCSSGVCNSTSHSCSSIASSPWLHTSGFQLYNGSNTIKLQACNILADSTWTSQAIITNADIVKIKSWGFNAIRSHLEWKYLQPTNSSSVDASVFTSAKDNLGASIDNIAQWAANNNMYVIFNLHWGSSFDAPNWVPTVSSSVGCTSGDDGRAVNIFGDANVRAGISYLYKYMATRYASNPYVIFEGINELLTPNDADAGQPFADFNDQWISAVESGEGSNSHIKIVEFLINQGWDVLYTSPYVSGSHQNVMLASHDYSPMDGWTGSSSQITYVSNRIASQEAKGHASQFPIIDTEFSKSQDQIAFPSFFNTILSAFANSDYQGWAYWAYCRDTTINAAGTSTYNINNPTIQSNVLPILQQYMNLSCSDGTKYNQCSSTQPKYCSSSGALISNCSLCGCASGQNCNATSNACYTPSVSLEWLHTSGQNIYDSTGKQVKLWGLVVTGHNELASLTQNNLSTIKSWGFNAIRYWVGWASLEPTGPTVTSTSYFTSAPYQLDNVVQWANNVGLYVILSPAWGSSYYPPPSWVAKGGDISNADYSGYYIDITNSTTLAGVANLYAFLANRYKSYSNVIFESMNELNTQTQQSSSSADMTNWRSWNNNWISAVEANEGANSHLKILQFLVYYNGGTAQQYYSFYPPYTGGTHSNIILATHDYTLVDSTSWSQTQMNNWASSIYAASKAAGSPWIDTEFSTAVGTYGSPPTDRSTMLQMASQAMVQNNISGWGYFCYNPSGGTDYSSAWAINNPSNTATLLSILQPYMVQNCNDGTAYGQCSSSKPLYCSGGTLISNCSQCGCSLGICQSNGTCISPVWQTDFEGAAMPSDGSSISGINATAYFDYSVNGVGDSGRNIISANGTAKAWIEGQGQNTPGFPGCHGGTKCMGMATTGLGYRTEFNTFQSDIGLSGIRQFYMSEWIYLQSNLSVPPSDDGAFYILFQPSAQIGPNTWEIFNLALSTQNSNGTWPVDIAKSGSGDAPPYAQGNLNIPLGQWIKVEFYINMSTNGNMKAWVNGQQLEATGMDTSFGGNPYYLSFDIYHTYDYNIPFSVWIDDVKVYKDKPA